MTDKIVQLYIPSEANVDISWDIEIYIQYKYILYYFQQLYDNDESK